MERGSKKRCEECLKDISSSNWKRHIDDVHNGSNVAYAIVRNDYKCRWKTVLLWIVIVGLTAWLACLSGIFFSIHVGPLILPMVSRAFQMFVHSSNQGYEVPEELTSFGSQNVVHEQRFADQPVGMQRNLRLSVEI